MTPANVHHGTATNMNVTFGTSLNVPTVKLLPYGTCSPAAAVLISQLWVEEIKSLLHTPPFSTPRYCQLLLPLTASKRSRKQRAVGDGRSSAASQLLAFRATRFLNVLSKEARKASYIYGINCCSQILQNYNASCRSNASRDQN